MSTPEPPSESGTPTEPQPVAPGEPANLPPPVPPAGAPPGAFGPPGYAASSPWVAPPREHWINPTKRVAVLAVAVVAALVLLAVGGLIGAAVSGGDDHDHGYVRMVPGYGNGPRFVPPGQHKMPFPRGTATPSPAPSKS
jgi:hypothetical protein